MKRGQILTTILIILIILVSIVTIVVYNKNNQLISERDQLSREKVELINEREQLRSENQKMTSKLSMLQDDVFNLKKSCISDNICKGHFPSIRWKCNVQGDAVDNGDKVCFCNDNCNLQFS